MSKSNIQIGDRVKLKDDYDLLYEAGLEAELENNADKEYEVLAITDNGGYCYLDDKYDLIYPLECLVKIED